VIGGAATVGKDARLHPGVAVPLFDRFEAVPEALMPLGHVDGPAPALAALNRGGAATG